MSSSPTALEKKKKKHPFLSLTNTFSSLWRTRATTTVEGHGGIGDQGVARRPGAGYGGGHGVLVGQGAS
jgi:hypothetical protein